MLGALANEPKTNMQIPRTPLLILFALIMLAGPPAADATDEAEPRLHFSENPARFGDPVTIRASGLSPGQVVTIRAEKRIPSRPDRVYRSQARLRADADGRIDLASDAPIDGSWSRADVNGLFWSMRAKDEAPPEGLKEDSIAVTLLDASDQKLVRVILHYPPALVEMEETPLHEDLPGAFVLRPTGEEPQPAIVLLGGSEGGDSTARAMAPQWAARGYVAVGYPYYSPAWGDQPQQVPGLPRGFANIPLDGLETVFEALKARDDVDADRVALLGISKGAEFVLAAASRIEGFAGVAAIVPSDVIWEGWGPGATAGETPSFSWRGEPLDFVPYEGIERAIGGVPADERVPMRVPHAEGRAAHPERIAAARIRVEDIDEPVFLLAGGMDQTWDSGDMAARIAATRAEAGLDTDVLIFADATHGLSGPPQSPTRTRSVPAKTAGWPTLEAFLERTLKPNQED
jgi:dienelactone hydrolase